MSNSIPFFNFTRLETVWNFFQKILAHYIFGTRYFQKRKKILELKVIFPKRYFQEIFSQYFPKHILFWLIRISQNI